MPLLELTCREGSLSGQAREVFISALGELLERWDDQPRRNAFRIGSALQIIELPASAMHEADQSGDTTYLLSVATAAGSLGTEQKAEFVTDVTKAILAADGGAPDVGRVWVHIREIPPGNWDVWQRADHARRAAQPGTVHSFHM